MKVKKSLETPDGTVEFEGELNQDEVDLILSVGLNYLLQQGAIPFKILPDGARVTPGEGSEQTQ